MNPPLILLYHGLYQIPRELNSFNLMVEPDRFRRQVELLKRRGYSFVTVSEFVRHMNGKPPTKLCALTFDDGTDDNTSTLRELLEELGVPATIYVCPGLLGRPSPFMPAETGIRVIDTDELQALAEHPLFEIGSHTFKHADLSSASPDEAYREMSESKAALEGLIGKPVLTFAYPSCSYSSHCPAAAKRAGYLAAVTCGPRGTWEPYELRRELVHSNDRILSFELKARGLYRPLHDSAPGRVARWATRPIRGSLRG